MKIKVNFHAKFREVFSAEEKDVELENGANIATLLDVICDSKQCREAVIDDEGRIKRDLKIIRKGRRTHFINDVNAEVEDGDIIILMTPVFGG